MKSFKKKLIFLAVIISFNGMSANFSYPLLDEVVYQFFKTYHPVNELIKGDKITFEKNPEGWEIVVWSFDLEIQKTELKDKQLFWSSTDRKYQQLTYSKNTISEDQFIDYYKAYKYFLKTNKRERVNYAIHCYYGYDNYNEDIINALENLKNIDDTLIYSLADAYLMPLFYYTHGADNLVSETVFLNGLKGLQLKKLLADNNPSFQTKVGDIKTKYGNDLIGVEYNSKIFFQKPIEKKVLHKDAFDLWMMESAKNSLNHCPENAILFTGGDNDTYPLLYIQQEYGYRTDVTVINQSLINTQEMISYLRLPENNISLTISENSYSEDYNAMVILESSTDHIPLGDLIKGINEETLKRTEYGSGEIKYSVSQKAVYVELDGKRIEWTINKARILTGDLAILDIIESNIEKRPVCFTVSQGKSAYLGLDMYLQQIGMVLVLQNEKSETAFQVNTRQMMANMFSNSFWEDARNIAYYKKTNYYFAFYQLINILIKENENLLARRALNMCFKNLPIGSKKINSVALYMMDLYARLNLNDDATGLLNRFLFACDAGLIQLENCNLGEANFRFIDDIDDYWVSVEILKSVIAKHDFLSNEIVMERIAGYDERIKKLLNFAIITHPYFNMLIGAKPSLLKLMQ